MDVKTEEGLSPQLELYTNPVDRNTRIKAILYELLLKLGVPLTVRIEEGDGYYLANGGEIVLILNRVNENIIEAVVSQES